MDMVVHRFNERIRDGLALIVGLEDPGKDGPHLAVVR